MANLVVDLSRFVTTSPHTNSQFTYRDIKAFNSADKKKLLSNYDFDAIKGSIRNIMEFRFGQRPLDPNFGNPLYGYLYENNTVTNLQALEVSIKEIFKKYEPRIGISRVEVHEPTDDDPHTIMLDIYYYVIGLPNSENFYRISYR